MIQTNLRLCQAGRESPLGIQEEHLDKAKQEGEFVVSRKLLLIYILLKISNVGQKNLALTSRERNLECTWFRTKRINEKK